jgi:hypothetical protein
MTYRQRLCYQWFNLILGLVIGGLFCVVISIWLDDLDMPLSTAFSRLPSEPHPPVDLEVPVGHQTTFSKPLDSAELSSELSHLAQRHGVSLAHIRWDEPHQAEYHLTQLVSFELSGSFEHLDGFTQALPDEVANLVVSHMHWSRHAQALVQVDVTGYVYSWSESIDE